jgi:translin
MAAAHDEAGRTPAQAAPSRRFHKAMSDAVGIEPAISEIIGRFESLAAVRDQAINQGRQIVRLSANAVRSTHRGDHAGAESLLDEAASLLQPLLESLGPFPEVYWAGYTQDALKEYAEARITAAIVRDRPVPGPDALGVADPAYLNALAEAASELRRQVLDHLRAGHFDRASHLLSVMDGIYAGLMLVDFPDAVTGGLRRTVDALRAVLERTRGDVTLASQQQRLETALREAMAAYGVAGEGGDLTPAEVAWSDQDQS